MYGTVYGTMSKAFGGVFPGGRRATVYGTVGGVGSLSMATWVGLPSMAPWVGMLSMALWEEWTSILAVY